MAEGRPNGNLVGASLADRIFVAGRWIRSASEDLIDVVNPATEKTIASVPGGGAEDVDRAVQAAASAFAEWSAWPVQERVDLVASVGDRLVEMSEQIAQTVSAEVGTPIALSRVAQAGIPAATFRSMADLASVIEATEEVGTSRVVREAAGVVAAITPWNYPLHQAAAKVAPALAAGCTVVLKPSEMAPLSALALAQVCEEVGLPPGALNVVQGRGAAVGEALVNHSLVKVVSFTGSVGVGRQIGALAGGSIKRVALELGGKSPSVILDDADLERAVAETVAKCFQNAGQSCNAHSRMLVPRALLAECTELARAAAETYQLGDPMDEETTMGPLAAAAQRERVRAHIQRARADGASVVTGGEEPPGRLPRGFYVRPTILGDVRNEMAIAREEVFGPVLSVIAYEGEAQAVAIANDSDYGLSGAVWSGDAERALAVAQRLRTGQVHVNGGKFNPLAPFGGFNQSGVGRELGRFGLDEFLEWKALHL